MPPRQPKPPIPSPEFTDAIRRVLSIPPAEAAVIVERTSARGAPPRRPGARKGAARKHQKP